MASEYKKEFENSLELNLYDKVETQRGWVYAKDLTDKDILIDEDNNNLLIKYLNTSNYKIQLEVISA